MLFIINFILKVNVINVLKNFFFTYFMVFIQSKIELRELLYSVCAKKQLFTSYSSKVEFLVYY